MRILVIGGNGFIGVPLMRELRSSGHDLAIFHRSAVSPVDADAVRIQGDRNRLSDHRKELQRFRPDVIIDLILSSGEQASQSMETIREVAPRVVAISSMDVYRAWGVLLGIEPGPLASLPLTEDSPVRTNRQIYAPEAIKRMQGIFSWINEDYDKVAVEEVIMNDAVVSGTVVRLPMVYGPGDPLHRLFPLLKRFADGRSSILLPDDFAAWRGPRGYVENVAHAIACAATSDQAAGRVYNVCDEPSLPELEWQTKIANTLEWSGRFVVLPRQRTPEHLLLQGNTAQHMVATSERIRSELGFREVISLEEAIRRTAAWEQQNPPSSIDVQQFDYAAEDAALRDAA